MDSKYNVHQEFSLKHNPEIIFKIRMVMHHKKHVDYTMENVVTNECIKIKETVFDDIFIKK